MTAGILSPPLALADGGMMGHGFNSGMMSWGGGLGWLFVLTWIVWLVVGVFLAIFLWQKINKK